MLQEHCTNMSCVFSMGIEVLSGLPSSPSLFSADQPCSMCISFACNTPVSKACSLSNDHSSGFGNQTSVREAQTMILYLEMIGRHFLIILEKNASMSYCVGGIGGQEWGMIVRQYCLVYASKKCAGHAIRPALQTILVGGPFHRVGLMYCSYRWLWMAISKLKFLRYLTKELRQLQGS